MSQICHLCPHNGGRVYASQPPMCQCEITHEYHEFGHVCDVEFKPVRHGKWTDQGLGLYECSACKGRLMHGGIRTGRFKFCPLCGAEMEVDR